MIGITRFLREGSRTSASSGHKRKSGCSTGMKLFARLCLTVFLGMCLQSVSHAGLPLAADGGTEYVIVTGAAPSGAETRAAEELSDYLGRVTGAEFPIVSETQRRGIGRGIYLGWTDFARAKGIDPAGLGEEEWIIKSYGADIVITGGRPRGTLYGVYEFLEHEAGCYWLSWNMELVPEKPDLTIPSLDRRGKPALEPREHYSRHHFWQTGAMQEKIRIFAIRNRQQWVWDRDTQGFRMLAGVGAHSFYAFVNPGEWFESNPEYFSMDRTGRRTAGNWEQSLGAAGSNLCLSNPAVAAITAENIIKEVRAQEERLKETLPEIEGFTPRIRAVELSQTDNTSYICACPDCTAISEREGSESGLLFKYVNEVAEKVEREFPEIKIRTLAYVNTDDPPKTVRPRDNVIVFWVDLYGQSDAHRPLTHDVNRGQAEMLRGWGEIADNIHVWDYGDMAGRRSSVGLPIMIPPATFAADVNFFIDNNVSGIFYEHERGITKQSFYDLSQWAAMQLFNNPGLDPEELVDTFISGFYGAAAGEMRAYYDFLEKAVMAEERQLTAPVVNSRTGIDFLDMDYVIRCREMLLRADAAAEPGTTEQLHVWREKIVVYKSILHDWNWFERTAGRGFPFAREEILDRYEVIRQAVMNHEFTGSWLEDLKKDLEAEMLVYRTAIPLPDRFSDLPPDRVMAFEWYDLHRYGGRLADDPDAVGGRALRLTTGISGINHGFPNSMGVYNRITRQSGPGRRLDAGDVPEDEKYHLYRIGTARVGRETIVWTHGTWLLSCRVDRAFQLDDGIDPSINDWDVYVSLKFEGPAYVSGSDRENAVSLERVILVRPEGWVEP